MSFYVKLQGKEVLERILLVLENCLIFSHQVLYELSLFCSFIHRIVPIKTFRRKVAGPITICALSIPEVRLYAAGLLTS